jgi:hypothetical protein
MVDALTLIVLPALCAGIAYLGVVSIGAWVGQLFGYEPKGYRDRLRSNDVERFLVGQVPEEWIRQASHALEKANRVKAKAPHAGLDLEFELGSAKSAIASALITFEKNAQLRQVSAPAIGLLGFSHRPALRRTAQHKQGEIQFHSLIHFEEPQSPGSDSGTNALVYGLNTAAKDLIILEHDLSQLSGAKRFTK